MQHSKSDERYTWVIYADVENQIISFVGKRQWGKYM